MLGDLFKKVRRSEPTQVLVLRRVVILISLFLLAVIFVVSCIGISDELPSVKTTFTPVDYVPAPDIAFIFNSNFTMNCIIYDNLGKTIQNEAECTNKNINSTIFVDSVYRAIFLPKSVNLDNKTTLGIYISPLGTSSNNLLSMRAFDSEFSGFRLDFDSHPTPFMQEIYHKNEYSLSQINNSASSYRWSFSRHRRRIIINNPLSYIGFGPNYDDRAYLDSNIQFVPPANTLGNNIVVIANLQSLTITEETEQRNKTIASALGTIGGVWGIIMSFYVFLFGAELVSPWGFVQKSLKFKPNFEDSELGEDEKNDLEKRTRHLEERGKFYEEYIISIPSDEEKGETKPWYRFCG